jgi:hypothetical protein
MKAGKAYEDHIGEGFTIEGPTEEFMAGKLDMTSALPASFIQSICPSLSLLSVPGSGNQVYHLNNVFTSDFGIF